MIQIEQIPNKEKNEYQALKEGLLKGDISPKEVSKKLIKLDQLTPSRDAAKDNLKFLQDKQVFDFINKRHPEIINDYYRLLSFFEFHVAQQLAGDNPKGAIKHFENAFENAKRGQSGDSWTAYVEGSLLYMRGKEIPEDLITRVTQPRNADILRNFNNGLKERKNPDYNKDYSKQ